MNGDPLRVACFSRYTRLGASSRLRALQFIPMLHDAGIQVDVFPLFDDLYLDDLYQRQQRRAGRVLTAYARRWRALRRARQHDVLWIEKELFPYLPWLLEGACLPAGMPVVVDYDDAVFHQYDLSQRASVRALLGRKIDRLMAAASCVSVGNRYLAARATQAGAGCVELVPTVVDVARYQVRPTQTVPGEPLVIGWIGSPATEHYLLALQPVLQAVCARQRARVVLVGASASMAQRLAGVPVQVQTWTEDTEAALIAGFDIGVMPLPDEPWERGKCGYKLIQYMACGLPVVASPVGVNRDIVVHGATGMLADGPAEWQAALQTLIDDPVQRRRWGLAGRQRMEEEYSMQVQGAHIARLLRAAAQPGGGR
ncbi:glycosyltransferase family 4 protein [Pseudaquabacterium pictum]|uniref:Glycosyl transferase n=1 Tax=Pseudaquabacterium pictum TaxID=2315236 RepID=A0A480ARM3_9BURK|nr:glycosyltransferase family 4 protein [Rubrivivax pictus]GCL63490.1 glycosyl transferase [Rubrivivax pictus]